MWVGEFTHGVFEESYRYWKEKSPSFPFPSNPTPRPRPANPPVRVPYDIGEFGDRVEARLAASGTNSRSRVIRELAYDRMEAALNLLGPLLFPLITAAEQRINGTREMPELPQEGRYRQGGRYELTGIVDVISSVDLTQHEGNPLVKRVRSVLRQMPGQFDVIVDYKGMRRPESNSSLWLHQEWQIQTYAWLRSQVPRAIPIAAGILVYVNEFFPSAQDMQALQQQLKTGALDIAPESGSADEIALRGWRRGMAVPHLSDEFALKRALRIVDVSSSAVDEAVRKIDGVVADIETCSLREHNNGNILTSWSPTGGEGDCEACDFTHFCPAPYQSRASHRRRTPVAPG
jgi:hypothetical protein